MTLISFFDEDPIDNIGDILYLLPQRCIFLGNDKVMKKRKRAQIEQFLRARNIDVQVEFRSLPRGDLDRSLEILRELIVEYPDSIFDVSGGTELHLVVAGIVSGMYDIPMYQRNGRSGKILWQYACDLETLPAAFSVQEVISLHSGAVIPDDSDDMPELTPSLCRDILALWEIAREKPTLWNAACNAFAALSGCLLHSDPLQMVIEEPKDKAAFFRADTSILAELVAEGFILNLSYARSGISFRFRDRDIHTILTKAGLLLELYTYMAVEWADDRAVSIRLDWDGIDVEIPGIQTRNELDVMMTYGMLPVCISCKNGEVKKEALYELETITEHFAGRYAKKVLVASYVAQDEETAKSLKQRARDMGIIPIFNVHEMTFDEFSQKLKRELIGI